jgi:tetratricopeptide (TPR) repeat protein/SAM-dependent methyltransferase
VFGSAVERYRAGAFAEAEVLCRQALTIDPRYLDCLQLLGVMAVQRNDLESAVAWLGQALKIREAVPALHYNMAVACRGLGRLDDAAAHYRRCVQLQPNHQAAHNNLGRVRHDQGRLEDAVKAYTKALALGPDPRICCNLGAALQDQGKFAEAIAPYEQARALAPNMAEAHAGLGSALQCLGRPAAAVASYERAAALKPDDVATLNSLAHALFDSGDRAKALAILQRSLAIGEAAESRGLFALCVKDLAPAAHPAGIREGLARALAEAWIRPAALARTAAAVLAADGPVGAAVARVGRAWPNRVADADLLDSAGLAPIAGDGLLRALLEATPVGDIALERWLTAMRALLLATAVAAQPDSAPGPEEMAFWCALARQCFLNEYVFDTPADEAARAQGLADDLNAALARGGPVNALSPIAVAAYMPLGTLAQAPRLLDRAWPDPLTALCAQQVSEPHEEMRLKADIPRLTPIDDPVSLTVQRQYEDNPYPRWIKAAAADPATDIDTWLARRFPSAPLRPLGKAGGIDILIAGCGTGQQPIEVAGQFREPHILAVDLSLTSLAYAKRMTEALGVSAITYAQADILKLASLGRSFDVIQASGVLHHLADPLLGWRMLLSLLRPNGLMYLGLYSERARRDVVETRAMIAGRGYRATAGDIRRCRAEMAAAAADSPSGRLARSPDFFTISSCRDLLFHVEEHRLTLPAIATFLANNGLTFIAFDAGPAVTRSYQEMFPDDPSMTDLGRWDQFESRHTGAFASMYQFWVQKSGAGRPVVSPRRAAPPGPPRSPPPRAAACPVPAGWRRPPVAPASRCRPGAPVLPFP